MWLYKVLEIYIFITLWITVLYYNNHPYCPNRNKGIELFVASIITIVTGIYDSRWRAFSRPRLPAIARKYRPWYSCHNSTTYLLSQFCFLSILNWSICTMESTLSSAFLHAFQRDLLMSLYRSLIHVRLQMRWTMAPRRARKSDRERPLTKWQKSWKILTIARAPQTQHDATSLTSLDVPLIRFFQPWCHA